MSGSPAVYRLSDPVAYRLSDYEEQRAQEEYWEHRDQAHGGKECDCPRPSLDVELAELAKAHRDEVHGGGECHCPPDEAPF